VANGMVWMTVCYLTASFPRWGREGELGKSVSIALPNLTLPGHQVARAVREVAFPTFALLCFAYLQWARKVYAAAAEK
jgi:hypothetical protein